MATILYRIGDGAEQSITATYGQSVEIPGSTGQDVTFRVETDEQTSVYNAPPIISPDPDAEPVGLVAPVNLFNAEQASFAETSHLDLRDNWVVDGERLVGLGVSGNDFRATLSEPLVAGRPHVAFWDFDPMGVSIRAQFGGDGSASGRNVNDDTYGFEYFDASEVGGNFTRFGIKPSTGFTGWVDNLQVFDLSSVDPTQVVCDVFIFGGDSNSTCATSDFVTAENRETPYDPRIWYLPCLRASSSFSTVGAERHVPFPMIEPVIGAGGAARMSPVHAAASRLVDWSAARGRPLLILALGDAGSGLMNTQDWRRPDRAVIETTQQQDTASRMWNEMIAMKAALEALGPAHEVVGAMWSMGQNDGFGTQAGADGYDASHTSAYHDFFNDVRAEFGHIPMVLSSVAPHTADAEDARGQPGFGSSLQEWVSRFDMDSGHANSVADLRVIQPNAGNPVDPGDPLNPHYSAHGMQENGRAFGDAMLELLSPTEQT